MANQENSHFIELASGVMALENSIFIENEYVKNKKESLEKLKTELQQIEREIELKEAIKKEIIEKEKHVDDNIKSVSNMRKMIRAHEHSLQYELEEEKKKTRSYNTKYQQSISKSENLWQEYEVCLIIYTVETNEIKIVILSLIL
ncbi:hypothetical protein C0J52_21632 [Blattella germanica]|nr:hypothetical protein C0J52_21632 [Blattella germanica]